MPASVATIQPKFAGHETFTLRYGWLKKAVDATGKDPEVFLREDALVTLGIGKNMVRSIRHWGLMTGVLEEDQTKPNNRGRFLRPSALGKLLFGPRGRDPYLEEPGTLWLLHWNLASTPAGPTTWFWTFNYLNDAEFTKDRLVAGLADLAEQYEWSRIADNSLQRDVDVFIRTYVSSRATKTVVLEDSLDSLLAELGLIQELDDGRVYALYRAERPTLSVDVFAHAVLAFWKSWTPTRQSLGFEELAYRPGSPGRVFQLSEDAFMSQVIHGKVHGATIELFQPLEIADGQEVEVTLRTVPDQAKSKPSGEGIRRSAGPLPDDSERDDELLAEIQRRRRSARSREVQEFKRSCCAEGSP